MKRQQDMKSIFTFNKIDIHFLRVLDIFIVIKYKL